MTISSLKETRLSGFEDAKAHSEVEGRSGMISSYRKIIKRGYQKPVELTVEEFKALCAH